jgi:hypothetical protein
MTLESRGVGDAPASELVIMKDGRQLATIRRTWSRRARSWELERQETTISDGKYHDIVEIKRSGTPPEMSGALLNAADLGATRGVKSAVAASLNPFVATFDFVDCGGYDGSDTCAPERKDLANADDEVNLALAEMVLACAIPEPFEPLVCNLALAHFLGRIVIQANASEALRKCEAKAAQKARCCTASSRIPLGTGAMLSISQAPSAATGDDTAGCEVDVNGDPASGTGGGGGSGGSIDVVCYYWVVYNVDTGEVLAIHLDHCDTYMT